VELFEQLRGRVAAESVRIQETARALASLDTLAGLAETYRRKGDAAGAKSAQQAFSQAWFGDPKGPAFDRL